MILIWLLSIVSYHAFQLPLVNYEYSVNGPIRQSAIESPAYIDFNFLRPGWQYGLEVKIGAQNLTFHIDVSGSSLVVPGMNCTIDSNTSIKSCGPIEKLYNMNLTPSGQYISCSSCLDSCKPVPQLNNETHCTFESSYVDNSYIKGTLNSDLITFGGSTINTTFVQIFSASPQFINITHEGYITGLIGLGPNSQFFNDLLQNNNLDNIYSMCLGPIMGHLTVGEIDPQQIDPIYVSLIDDNSYSVSISGITVENKYIQSNVIATIDSGIYQTIFPKQIFENIKKAILDSCQLHVLCKFQNGSRIFNPNRCFAITAAEIARFPNITFHVKYGSKTEVLYFTPNFYFQNTRTIHGNPCVAFTLRGSDKENRILLGNSFLRGYTVIFDRANQKVGFSMTKTCGEWNTGIPIPSILPNWVNILIVGSIAIGLVIITLVLYKILNFGSYSLLDTDSNVEEDDNIIFEKN